MGLGFMLTCDISLEVKGGQNKITTACNRSYNNVTLVVITSGVFKLIVEK